MDISREELLCRHAEGMSSREISEDTGLSSAAVRGRLRRLGISNDRVSAGVRNLDFYRKDVADMLPADAVEYLLDVIETLEPGQVPDRVAGVVKHGFTASEARLLLQLAAAKGPITRERLFITHVGCRLDHGEIRVIDVFLCRIRRKIAGMKCEIRNVWGFGYELVRGEGFLFPWEK